MRETAQRQADGASKAEQRIQPAVCADGGYWDRKTQWLSVRCTTAGALSLHDTQPPLSEHPLGWQRGVLLRKA